MSARTERWPRPLRMAAAWLFDRGCPPAVRRTASAVAVGLFVVLVVTGAVHHEIWRDEARALTIALEPDSWLGLRATLANEGHPGLWHFVLRTAHAIVGSPLVLPVVSALIGVAGAALLFYLAPLPTWWRVAFLFGWIPLHAASVQCRNYGIAMLLAFVFCALASRGNRLVLAAAALALLANTNAYGAMMAGCFAPFLGVEAARNGARWPSLAAVVLLPAAGLALCAWTILPSPESKFAPGIAASLEDPAAVGLAALGEFGHHARSAFGLLAPAAWAIVLLAVLATAAMPHLALGVVLQFGVAAWFMHGIYRPTPQHGGMLFTFLCAVTWLRAARPRADAAVVPRVAWRVLLFGVWPVLLVHQGYRGLRELKSEIELVNTAAPELARLLEREDLAGAVLVGEPDYFLDALPWYRDNLLFVAREGTFARRVSWSVANRSDLDLGELLAAAQSLQQEREVPVLLVIGHAIGLEQDVGEVVHGYGNRFRWTAAQHADFRATTELVARLPARPSRARGDERYTVYRLR